MSRLIVLNLPKHTTTERFKAHFEERGFVTDAKLMTTAEGRFRRFGFVGYKTDKEAQAAQKHFNGSYLDTSKIDVQIARDVGNSDLARPWSKYSKGSSAFARTEHGKVEHQAKRDEEREQRLAAKRESAALGDERRVELVDALTQDTRDPRLKEYLQAMLPRSKTQTWANDDTQQREEEQEEQKIALDEKTFIESLSDDNEQYDDLPNAKSIIQGLFDSKRQHEEDDVEDAETAETVESDAEEEHEEGRVQEVAADEKVVETSDVPDFQDPLRRFKVVDSAQTAVQAETPEEQSEQVEQGETILSTIVDTGRLFVRNLAYSCTAEELEALFAAFGPVAEIHVSMNKETKISKGYGFVLFLIPEHAVKAYVALSGKVFQGRLLDITPASDKPQPPVEDNTNATFKTKRDAQRKQTSMQEFSWNSLFMNSDAVIAAMADRLGVKKSDILNVEEGDMAVKLALAETQIINDTKEHLLEHGIDLGAFIGKKRSKTVIIVKNIPYHTEIEEINDLFGKFGSLGRVILPPTKTICIVEYEDEHESKTAFRQLAYSRFKSLPLYLEWAPENTFTSALTRAVAVAEQEEHTLVIAPAKEEDSHSSPTIYCKNLNFSTTQDALKLAFQRLNGFQSARLSTKPDPKNSTLRLSMGFGFLEFKSIGEAREALKVIQGTMLDGHVLQCKMSNASTQSTQRKRDNTADDDNASTKIMIRNIPFEATKREIRALFTPFGQIKAVRIPKKMDGTHRGFGFIHFLTKQEAKSAMDSLCNTHFYGRHLVLDWAKEDDTVDTLREKTKREFDTEYAPRKQTKFTLNEMQEEE